ncbi:hypothetical protein [Streptomyces sp. NPDC002855]|uniref:hypothetical protein n=1 Tax=Streptomyces sp. NPDC002855 TaxID=3154437 RepID=UPI003322A4AA
MTMWLLWQALVAQPVATALTLWLTGMALSAIGFMLWIVADIRELTSFTIPKERS